MKNLFECYNDILEENHRWNPTKSTSIEHEFPKVLQYPASYNFIFELIFFDGHAHPLSIMLGKYNKIIDKKRYTHTVSLYLLGIQIAESIGFDMFNLPIWDNCCQRNFLHNWAITCLFHDIGYFIENNNCIFKLSDYKTISDFFNKSGLEYNLNSMDITGLIESYYNMRTEKHSRIDHGIVSAMLLYDELMKRNSKMEYIAETAIMISEKPMYGDKYKADILRYSLAIARHNMWVVSDNDSKAEDYKMMGLNCLIAKPDGSHKISFKKEPLLFLLCLLDTIEPTKAYDERPSENVVSLVNLELERSNTKFKIYFEDSVGDRVKTKLNDCADWLDVSVNADEFTVTFDMK